MVTSSKVQNQSPSHLVLGGGRGHNKYTVVKDTVVKKACAMSGARMFARNRVVAIFSPNLVVRGI